MLRKDTFARFSLLLVLRYGIDARSANCFRQNWFSANLFRQNLFIGVWKLFEDMFDDGLKSMNQSTMSICQHRPKALEPDRYMSIDQYRPEALEPIATSIPKSSSRSPSQSAESCPVEARFARAHCPPPLDGFGCGNDRYPHDWQFTWIGLIWKQSDFRNVKYVMLKHIEVRRQAVGMKLFRFGFSHPHPHLV